MTTDREERFWSFSTALYGRPGVETTLLALQDEDGLDVSLLLFCLYAASRGETVDGRLAMSMIAVGESWGKGVVAPLRTARRELKRLAPETVLREKVKQLELAAERAMQAELEALLAGGADGEPDDPRLLAERNLMAWFAASGAAPSGSPPPVSALRARLALVLDRAFP